jgi:hypothetical protein
MAVTFSWGASITSSFYSSKDKSLIYESSSVAYMEINLILARLIWTYDMEIVNKSMDWESESSLHVMWSKPDLKVRFRQARGQ